MHAKQSLQPLQPSSGGTERPLATSAFKGQARLRELEHLAETARKVRDQAASELTRGGSTHHIARDRIGAAERMLKKTQQEIAELRAQLGPVADPAAAQPKPKDFELAMMLGHSKATFNRDETGQTAYEIQQGSPIRSAKKTASGKPAIGAAKQTKSVWRTLTFAVLISLGAGLGATGTYVVATTSSLTEASQILRDGALQLVNRLRTLIPTLALPASTSLAPTTAVVSPLDTSRVAVTEPRRTNAQQTQELQARAAAEQRLARQIAGLK
ncbi:MAG: hypothetical protein KKE76_12735 [Gammaproteobacteria bacterium]|nr:hypothetical protein [Gammaproteobacteria bacterium]